MGHSSLGYPDRRLVLQMIVPVVQQSFTMMMRVGKDSSVGLL
jgi:hypothetical protein